MTTTGIFILVGLGFAVLSVTVAAYVGRHDNSDRKTDHALVWFTAGGALATILRIFVVLFYQRSNWWTYYSSYDYLQGVPVLIFLAYLWWRGSGKPSLFQGEWAALVVCLIVAGALVFIGKIVWPAWLVCWTVSWLAHHKFS